LRYLSERHFSVLSTSHAKEGDDGLALSARLASAILKNRQQKPGYWLTSFTGTPSFEHPHPEMNIYLTALMVDVLDPVARLAGLEDNVRRAREHLAGQIESQGLVRYHGRPDAPTIGTLGCVITPDADDTALVWRIAPGPRPELLPAALAILADFRTPAGLYRTWLAQRDHYQCIDPGKDPDPADLGIQMHVLLLLARADPPAARTLYRALAPAVAENRKWVYYQKAPLVPILRAAELQQAGYPLRLPPSRLQTDVPGQNIWVTAFRLLHAPAGTQEVLRTLAEDNFSNLRRSPPLLYHNDLTASVPRFYWSEDVGLAIWLRLYYGAFAPNSREQ
jgi:hypothetical protein